MSAQGPILANDGLADNAGSTCEGKEEDSEANENPVTHEMAPWGIG